MSRPLSTVLACVALGCSSALPPVSTAGALGVPCTATADCKSGLTCVTTIDFPQPVCEQACDPAQTASCPTGYRCEALQSGRFCMRGCITDLDCGQDRVCRGPFESVERFCLNPATVPASCTFLPALISGGMVGPATEPAGCQKPVVASALPAEQVQHLGVHAVNDTVSFNVAPGTYGLNIVEQAVDAGESLVFEGITLGNAAVPLTLTGPSGQTLYDDFDAGTSPEAAYIYVGDPAPVESVVNVPNTSASLADVAANNGLPSGTWNVTVNDWANECAPINADTPDAGCDGGSAPGIYDLSVLTRPKPSTGRVDLAFYLVNEGLLTSQQAVTDASVIRMVRALADVYGRQGICPGKVTFYDLPAWARAKYSSGINADEVTPCSNLFQLFTLSQPGNTVNFFLVQSISSGMSGGFSVVGLDGTVPGPSSLNGSIHSGAAVSSADLEPASLKACGATRSYVGCGPDFVGYVAAHEGGHWLGLFHTTEGDGELFDPLSDTPTCACESCAPQSERNACGGLPDGGMAIVTGADCSSGQATCGGADNLMFWLLDDGATGRLSSEQVQVMRSNVVVQ